MKYMKILLAMAVCGATLALTGKAQAESKPGVVTVVRIQGEARYTLGDGQWHPLVAGKVLGPGAVIQTGHSAKVDVVFGHVNDVAMPASVNAGGPPPAPVAGVGAYLPPQPASEQNVIRLSSDTVLAIDKLMTSNTGVDTVGDTELDLRSGNVFGNVKKMSAMSEFLIKTPNGVAGIRGTLFAVAANGMVAVLEGSVVVSLTGANGQTTTAVVGAGQYFDPQTGTVIDLATTVQGIVTAVRNGNGSVVNELFHELDQFVSTVVNNPLYTQPVSVSNNGNTEFVSPVTP